MRIEEMRPHRFSNAEQDQFHDLFLDLTYLGQKGSERLEVVRGEGEDFTLELRAAPSWLGRLIEWLFGKRSTLKNHNVAYFVNRFVIANQAMLESSDRLLMTTALKTMRRRFKKHGQLRTTLTNIIRTLKNDEQRRNDNLGALRRATSAVIQESAPFEARRDDIRRRIRDLQTNYDAMYNREMVQYHDKEERHKALSAQQNDKLVAQETKKVKIEAKKERRVFLVVNPKAAGYLELHRDRASKDLAILCKDGKIVLAHRQLLEGMHLFHQFYDFERVTLREDKQARYLTYLEEFSSETVEFFVDVHYGIKKIHSIPTEILAELYVLADRALYMVPEALLERVESISNLRDICEEKLLANMAELDPWDYFPNPNFSERIQQRACELIAQNLSYCMEDPAFLKLSDANLTLILNKTHMRTSDPRLHNRLLQRQAALLIKS